MSNPGTNDALKSMSPASVTDCAVAYAVDIAKSIYRLTLRRTKRTSEQVDSEYNLSNWKKVLSDRTWSSAPDLATFLAPPNPTQRLRKADGEIVRVSAQQYYQYRISALGDLIARHCGNEDRIVELGAGYGYNLFSLHLTHPGWKLKGLDIAENGIAAGRKIAAHFGLSGKIILDRIDLTNPSDPNFSAITDQVVFTYFCIEQIPYDVKKVIENILASRPKRVINIEPTTELLSLTTPRDWVSRFYIRSVDYQTELFSTLDELERQGRIRIVARERMAFAPAINNDGFLYCWEPV